MKHVFLAAAVSGATALLLIRAAKLRGGPSLDRDFDKPQKIHTEPVPRIGGVAIFIGLFAAAFAISNKFDWAQTGLALKLLACALPAFVAGVAQDFTDTLTPRGRAIATAVSAVLAYYVLDAAIHDTDIPGLDWLVSYAAGSLALTVVAVTGIAHAINLIDGFNGLASMCVVIMLTALAYVGFQVEDPLVGSLALAGIGAVLGFFIWNFPAGLIFLGDGGAYFLGFWVAEVSLLLLMRNPGEVSPLFPLLVCIYPVFETLFSIYRRRFLRSMPPSLPDGIHLHSLIYRRALRWAVGHRGVRSIARRNSMTAPYLWLLCTSSVAPAMLFWNNTPVLAVFLVLFGITYVALYWRIVRFKSPRWLKFRPSRAPVGSEADNRRT